MTLAEIEGFNYEDSSKIKAWRNLISRCFLKSKYNVQFTLFLIKRDISHKYSEFMELAPSYVESLPHISWELIGNIMTKQRLKNKRVRMFYDELFKRTYLAHKLKQMEFENRAIQALRFVRSGDLQMITPMGLQPLEIHRFKDK